MTPAPLPKRKRGRPSLADQKARLAAELALSRKSGLTQDQRVERSKERFDAMWKLGKGCINNGWPRALIVSGGPGIGKSHTLEGLLSAAKEDAKINNYTAIHGTITGVNLYKKLWEFNGKRDIILMDDSDALYEDEDAMNLLKAAVDTTKVRNINWLAESNVLRAANMDTKMVYEGTMMFITNLDFQGIVDHGKHKMIPHFRALMDRAIYLDLMLHDIEDLLAWTTHMVRAQHILVQSGCSREQEELALKWINDNWTGLRSVSIRTAKHIGQLMINNPSHWESIAKMTLLR